MSEPKYPNINVQLSGQDGNAFSIIARVQQALRRDKISSEEVEKFIDDAMSGDYNHVLQTCMKWVNVE